MVQLLPSQTPSTDVVVRLIDDNVHACERIQKVSHRHSPIRPSDCDDSRTIDVHVHCTAEVSRSTWSPVASEPKVGTMLRKALLQIALGEENNPAFGCSKSP